ncbi:transmembrane channel-like protein 5 [Ischnura elegans]|uniref:transmembrane channel-like protein 5 n=1 Tax=Ischnura elegans TaxID=197161 RepID=UPI001ED86D8A|nr:transmembrane channel-like protein 5 [Ischnura elegans]XP_046385274.1 transmembrane channel-like protein 5 [Ischnura elegans]
MRKRSHNKSETMPLDQVESLSSGESSVSREAETRFQAGHRSLSMDAGDAGFDKLHLPKNLRVPETSSQSTFELRRRRSSMGFGRTLPLPSRHPSCLLPSVDGHAERFYSVIEGDDALMEDNPVSLQMRIETLRRMPASLTLKRSIKHKLGTSVSLNPKRSHLSLKKRMKYLISIYFSRFKMWLKDIVYVMEPWYGSIKVIEGHFGTSTATYFRFLRWLFVINALVSILSMGFLVVPQLLLHIYKTDAEGKSLASGGTSVENEISDTRTGQIVSENASSICENCTEFAIGNLLTGEGWLENTELYYGFYSNQSVSLIPQLQYSIPESYIFTMVVCYALMFITVAHNAAKAYRKSYIETGCVVKHMYSHKLFCGWDFGIATEQGAQLKRQSILNEFKELLHEEAEKVLKEQNPTSCMESLMTFSLRLITNFLFFLVICSTGLLVWVLLSIHKTWDVAGDPVDVKVKSHPPTITVSLLVTLILLLVPMFFSYMTRWERFRSPRMALYVTLWRTFGLEVVVVCVLLGFWLHSPDRQCWETSLGQEIYRLVIMDLLITIFGTFGAQLIRSRMHVMVWDKIGMPEFDIARNTLNLIYNQSLFWIGFFFSPLLSLIIAVKTFLTFYIKKIGLMYYCQPSAKAWRAAQTETIFLVLSFLSLFGILFALGFMFTRVPSSNCGPFKGYDYMYQMVVIDILSIVEESITWKILSYTMRPGVVGCVLVSMCVGIYYVRAVAMARVKMVKILREMLVLEAKDKEYLLANIFNLTEGKGCHYKAEPKREFLYSERSSTFEFRRRSEDDTGIFSEDSNHLVNVTQLSNLEDSIVEESELITHHENEPGGVV